MRWKTVVKGPGRSLRNPLRQPRRTLAFEPLECRRLLNGLAVVAPTASTALLPLNSIGTDLALTNVAPTVSLAGATLTYTFTVSNNGPNDAQNVVLADALSYGTTFLWNSGSPGWTTTNPATGTTGRITATIPLLKSGSTSTFDVEVTVAANSGDGSTIDNSATVTSSTPKTASANNAATAATTIHVSGAFSSPDPFDLTKQDLLIGGTAGNDAISISPAAATGTVPAGGGALVVAMNGRSYGPFNVTGRIVAYTNSGNDMVTVSPAIYLPAWLFAGSGNDTLAGGSGNNVLVGGGGRCTLTGGAGRSLIIAGNGSSRLLGGQLYGATDPSCGGAIMIGGSTIYDRNEMALNAILQEWSSADGYQTRMQKIEDGGLPLAGVALTMTGPAPTITRNSVVDQLLASCGMDWFWNVSGINEIDNPRSAQVNEVSAPTVRSVVTAVSSSQAAGVYGTGTTIPITVTFSNVVNVTGTPQLALSGGAAANYAGGSGTTVLTFNYTVAGEQNNANLDYASTGALLLNGGTIRDVVGDDAVLTLPLTGQNDGLANRHIVIDTTPPTVSVNNSVVLTNNSRPTLTGTVTVALPSIGIADVSVYEPGGQSVLATISGTTWSATLTTALTDGVHDLWVFALDNAGNLSSTRTSVTVESAPVVTLNPISQTVVAGSTVTFTAAASGKPTPTVSWQVSTDGGNTFTAINGATSTAYTCTASSSLNGCEYEAVFTNAAGSATAMAATLTVQAAPTVTLNPTAQTVTAGGTATFTAAASGNPTPSVAWKASTDGGRTFTPIAGATSTTYSLTAAISQNGYQYEAVFTNAAGSATTTAATLTVQTAPTVTLNPTAQTVVAGNTATFTARAGGSPTPSVQWKVSTNGGATFTAIVGATATTYSFTTNIVENGYQFEAVFSNAAGSATTTAAWLAMQTVPTVIGNPANQTAIVGNTATFTAAASGIPTPGVQWKVSTDGGKTFAAIPGATTTTYGLTAAISQNGCQYEAVFTNAAGNATTTAATLTVMTVPALTLNPIAQTVVAGNTATFTAAASGIPTPSVQWKVSSDGGNTFAAIPGATSSTFSLTATISQNGCQYEAVFTSAAGSVTTTAATLTVEAAPVVSTSPVNHTVIAGHTAIFVAAASGNPTPDVQWQVSTDGGQTFSDIPVATSEVYSFTARIAQNGYLYKAVFTNFLGSATTAAVTLTVQAAPAATTNPSSQAVIAGNTATFTAAASGNPTPSVQWQVSTDGGSTFNNIPDATSATYSFTASSEQNGYQYKAVFTNPMGSATTTAATLTVQTTPIVTVTPLITNKAKPTLTGTVSDASPSSGIASVTVLVGGQTLTATVGGST